eukprot:642637-Pleurochrysis_carterae.AAC.1
MPPVPCAAESAPPAPRVCPTPPRAPMLVARSTFTMRCVAAGHPGGAPTHRSPYAPPARSNSRSLQSAIADSSAACEPDVISMATPGGVSAASASATCSLPGEPNAASNARRTSCALHAVASCRRSPSNAFCPASSPPPSSSPSPASAACRLCPTCGGAPPSTACRSQVVLCAPRGAPTPAGA